MPIVMVTAVHDIQVALQACAMALTITCLSLSSASNCWPPSAAPWRIAASSAKTTPIAPTRSPRCRRTQQLNNALIDLEKSYDITLEALGDALDLKDAETEGHSGA